MAITTTYLVFLIFSACKYMKQSDSDLCMYSYADEDKSEIKDSWEKQI